MATWSKCILCVAFDGYDVEFDDESTQCNDCINMSLSKYTYAFYLFILICLFPP